MRLPRTGMGGQLGPYSGCFFVLLDFYWAIITLLRLLLCIFNNFPISLPVQFCPHSGRNNPSSLPKEERRGLVTRQRKAGSGVHVRPHEMS